MPYRDEDEARLFKPMGDLGQIVRMVSFHILSYQARLPETVEGMGYAR